MARLTPLHLPANPTPPPTCLPPTVLPLPYAQLLKIFSIFFVFTVPFTMAPAVGLFTPFVTLFLAMGYFGLDQVGHKPQAAPALAFSHQIECPLPSPT